MASLSALVAAHRGHASGAPEQTMAAFRAAVQLGADVIEADVHFTRDRQLVLCHDAMIDRTTDGTGPIVEHTFAQLRTLDAGSWFDERFAGERMPSLDELYDLALEAGIALCLEVKGETASDREAIAHAVAGEIARRGRLGLDTLASFDHSALAAASRSVSGLRIAPERLPERGPADAASLVAQARAIDAPIMQHHHADLDERTVSDAHAAGIAIWAWPPLTHDEIAHALELGVDLVMGDDVAALRAAVDQRSTETRRPSAADA